MKGFVLCAFLLALGADGIFGVNLDHLNDSMFPGNAGWNAQLQSRFNDPMFPGNAGWNERLQNSIKERLNSATNTAYQYTTGDVGSNVVISPVVQTMSDGVTTNTNNMQNHNIGSNYVFTPIIQSINSDGKLINGPDPASNTMQNMQNINIGTDTVSPALPNVVPVAPKRPNIKPVTAPYLQNLRIPHAPPNFPFPPECSEVENPGFKFSEPFKMTVNNQIQKQEIRYRSFLCTDPEYGQDSFYMQITEQGSPLFSGVSRQAAYYDKNGASINYSRKMVLLPLGESLPETPRNDYLGIDSSF